MQKIIFSRFHVMFFCINCISQTVILSWNIFFFLVKSNLKKNNLLLFWNNNFSNVYCFFNEIFPLVWYILFFSRTKNYSFLFGKNLVCEIVYQKFKILIVSYFVDFFFLIRRSSLFRFIFRVFFFSLHFILCTFL